MRDFGGEKWLPQGGSWKPETNMEQLWQVGFRLITHLVLFFGSTVALVMGWTWINSVFGGVTQCSGSLVMYSGTRNPETRGGCPRKFDPRTWPGKFKIRLWLKQRGSRSWKFRKRFDCSTQLYVVWWCYYLGFFVQD